MRKSTKFMPLLVLGIVGTIPAVSSAVAMPITYTEQATATGSLGGVMFTDESVLLTMGSDTNNVINPVMGIFENVTNALVKATVSVNGASAVTFTDSIAVFVSQTPAPPGSLAQAGFADLTVGLDILDTANAAFSTYDLKSFIGPITGSPANIDFDQSFPTTGGAFILTGVSGPTSIFTASTTTVPEPSTLALMSVAVGGLSVIRRRRKYLEDGGRASQPSNHGLFRWTNRFR
jgi:hypothetical protein